MCFQFYQLRKSFIKQLNTIIYNFLWNGPDKIARLAVVNDIKFGGLRLTDIETSIISLRLAWLARIYSPGRIPWKAFLDYLLEDYGGTFFVSCNYNMRDYNINSLFYSELLQWWDDFRNAFLFITAALLGIGSSMRFYFCHCFVHPSINLPGCSFIGSSSLCHVCQCAHSSEQILMEKTK